MFQRIKDKNDDSYPDMGGMERMRILRQPLLECLISFVVSQNNNI